MKRSRFLTAVCAIAFLAWAVLPLASVHAQQKTLKLGMLLAMTGPGAFYGQVMSRGAQLAVDQINKAGGLGGYKLELVIEDHKSGDADAGVSGARKMLDVDKVPVILTSYSAPTLAIQPLAVEKQALLLNGGGVGSQLVNKANLYNTRMLSSQTAPFIVQWATDKLKAKRVAMLYWNDAAGQSVAGAIKTTCAKAGCQVVAQEPHDIGAKSYTAQLARIKAARPDVLMLGTWGDDVGYVLNQARAYGLTVPILGIEWTPNAQKIGGKAMESYVIAVDRFDPEGGDAKTKAFVEAYRAAYKGAPEFYAANYYEHVQYVLQPLIKRVVERKGDPSKPGEILAEMTSALKAGVTFQSVYGGDMQVHGDGTVIKPLGVFEVKDGNLGLVGRIVGGKIQG
ncbi:MAG: amino acid ABC transporter substrate-binding protein [Candidatus Rokubacteria bacterium]|nr:amino acid ABC transporter substrate-binding protein [Candidatus Rokubacteria bacterium]